MIKSPVKYIKLIVVIVIAAFLIITSCEKAVEEEVPVLPPVSTFQMSFDDMPVGDDSITDQNALLKNLSVVQQYTYQHWFWAAAEVTVWNAAVVTVMALPVASFVESFNHEPVYHKEGKYWTWSYNFNLSGLHDAELKGFYESDSVVWEMRIDTKMAYEGRVSSDAKSGYWLLKNDLNDTDYWLQINWNRANDTIGDIKYLVLTSPGKNGYIHYGATGEDLNRYYYIYKPAADNLIRIEWNATNKKGRIINKAIFGDEEWNCWDELLRDMNCE